VIDADTPAFVVPEPALFEPVLEPYRELVPYSKYHDVDAPFGLTVPLSVAEVGSTPVTGPVIDVGAAAKPSVARPIAASPRMPPPVVRNRAATLQGAR
jgi:hypothetical protein